MEFVLLALAVLAGLFVLTVVLPIATFLRTRKMAARSSGLTPGWTSSKASCCGPSRRHGKLPSRKTAGRPCRRRRRSAARAIPPAPPVRPASRPQPRHPRSQRSPKGRSRYRRRPSRCRLRQDAPTPSRAASAAAGCSTSAPPRSCSASGSSSSTPSTTTGSTRPAVSSSALRPASSMVAGGHRRCPPGLRALRADRGRRRVRRALRLGVRGAQLLRPDRPPGGLRADGAHHRRRGARGGGPSLAGPRRCSPSPAGSSRRSSSAAARTPRSSCSPTTPSSPPAPW